MFHFPRVPRAPNLDKKDATDSLFSETGVGMDINKYEIHGNSSNRGEHKAYFLSCECGLCNQWKSSRFFKVFYPHTM